MDNNIANYIRDLFLNLDENNYHHLINYISSNKQTINLKFEVESSYAGLNETVKNKVSLMTYAVSAYVYSDINTDNSINSLKVIDFLIAQGYQLNEKVDNKSILFYALPSDLLFKHLLDKGARLTKQEYNFIAKQNLVEGVALTLYNIYLEKDALDNNINQENKPIKTTIKNKL